MIDSFFYFQDWFYCIFWPDKFIFRFYEPAKLRFSKIEKKNNVCLNKILKTKYFAFLLFMCI